MNIFRRFKWFFILHRRGFTYRAAWFISSSKRFADGD